MQVNLVHALYHFPQRPQPPFPSTKDGAWRHYVGQIMVKGGACLTVGWTQVGDEELVCLSSCGHMSQKRYRRGRLQTKALL